MRRTTIVHGEAPPERLAALRVITGVFALAYLVLRVPVFLRLRDRNPADFEGAGLAVLLPGPVPAWLVTATVAIALVSGAGYVTGTRFRLTGPVFALAMLALTTYRSSWGQLLHFENLMVLHLLILGVAASADAWSIDARHGRRAPSGAHDYASPLRLACIVVVVAYVIAGFAKLRYGGLDWIAGDTLRNHIAYSSARLDLLGGTPSPLARPVTELSWTLPPMAAASVVIELAAPLALLGGWYRNGWVLSAWLMHAAIAASMFVAFPYPLFLAAFAPFFALERAVEWVRARTPSPVVGTSSS